MWELEGPWPGPPTGDMHDISIAIKRHQAYSKNHRETDRNLYNIWIT